VPPKDKAAPSISKIEVASKEKMAFPLPDVPSIAVLPFVNMSEDSKQEFLCDGITESIITALSKVPSLFVISRNSTFFYKGKPVKVKQVSEELGVRYVMEGSVQRSSDRVRITVQFIDALSGNHIWAERYDRELKDLFALQDEITTKILTATQVKLTAGERAAMVEKYFKGKHGLDCYLKILEGSKHLQLHTIEANNVARRIAEEAIAMCPKIPWAYNLLAWVYRQEYRFGSSKSPGETIERTIDLAQKTLALDNSIAEAHALLSHMYCAKREYDKAIAEGERAVALDPSGSVAHEWYAMTLIYAGRPEEAIPLLQKAIRLSPLGSTSNFVFLGHAFRMAGRFEDALSAYNKALQLSPHNIFPHIGLAVTYIQTGRENEARDEGAEVIRLNPKFSLDSFAKTLSNKDQAVTDNFVAALRKAGLK
jgi:adenylate cyclase